MALLQTVMQKITGKDFAATPCEPAQKTEPTINTSQIRTLYALLEKRALIDVVCHRSGSHYQSMILSVDPQTQSFQVDEFFPSPVNVDYLKGDEFTISYRQQGAVLVFSTTLLAINQESRAPMYLFNFPESVEYKQRRQSNRIPLSTKQPLSVRLTTGNSISLFATAQNLSAGGMRLTVGGNMVDQLPINSQLPGCEFKFHNDFKVSCQALIKAMRFNRTPYRHTEISIEFSGLKQQDFNQLNQLVGSYFQSTVAA